MEIILSHRCTGNAIHPVMTPWKIAVTARTHHQNRNPPKPDAAETAPDGLDDLVVMAGRLHPIPSRTRP